MAATRTGRELRLAARSLQSSIPLSVLPLAPTRGGGGEGCARRLLRDGGLPVGGPGQAGGAADVENAGPAQGVDDHRRQQQRGDDADRAAAERHRQAGRQVAFRYPPVWCQGPSGQRGATSTRHDVKAPPGWTPSQGNWVTSERPTTSSTPSALLPHACQNKIC
jgi:hypothetical protein